MSQKAVGLLAYLAIGPSGGYTRERLAGLFWGETDEKRANFNLRRGLWSIRKAIGQTGDSSNMYIVYEDGRYFFNRHSDHWLDVEVLEHHVRLCLGGHKPRIRGSADGRELSSLDLENLRGALQLYRDDFLTGCRPHRCPDFIDWLFFERDRLRQTYVRGLGVLATAGMIRGDHRQAVADYRRILDVDPLNETACRQLTLAFYKLGNRDMALDLYRTFCRAFHEQLGLSPSPEFQELYRAIHAGTLTLGEQTYARILPGGTTVLAPPQNPFVGRQLEQAQLYSALDLAREGNGCLVTISGEEGVGKSRLAEEFLRQLGASSLHILRARCYSYEQRLPYQPIIDALRSFLSSGDLAYIRRMNRLWLREVAELLPELHSYVPSLSANPALLPGQERNRLFEGLAQFMIHVSQHAPLILFLDDFHAADEPTYELIHYLARRLVSDRVLVLCALRQGALADRQCLTSLLRELDRDKRLLALPLKRLSEAEVLDLVQQTLREPIRPVELAHQLYAETGGNAFFVVEMLRTYQEEQGNSVQNVTIPASVKEVIERRLGRLDNESRQTLISAAVIGRQFDSELLQRVHDGHELELLNVLDRLEFQHWIVELSAERPGSYEFSHGLVREAIYELLGEDRRRRLHRRVGLALESIRGANEEVAGVLALHFLQADEREKALLYSLRAAARARRLYANREVVAHYRNALSVAAGNQGLLSATELMEVNCRLGQALELLGDYDAAIDVYGQAVDSLDFSKRDHRRVGYRLAMAYDHKGHYDQALRELGAIAGHLTSLQEPVDRLEAALVARGRAKVYLHQEKCHQALAFCRQALALMAGETWRDERARVASEMDTEWIAINEIMAECYLHSGNNEIALGNYRQALEAAQKQDRRSTIARLLIGLGKVARRRGDYAGAETYARQSLGICQSIGYISGQAASLGLLGDVAYHRGDFEQAISHHRQARGIYRQIGDLHGAADAYLALAFVRIDQERIDEAAGYLEEALAIGQRINAALVLIRAQYHCARVARARGQLTDARARAEHVIDAAQQADFRLLEAAGHHLLGDVLARQRQWVKAEFHLVASLRLFESLEDRFEIAWALRSYARLLADQGDRYHAQAQLQRALALFTELGATEEMIKTEAAMAHLRHDGDESSSEITSC